MYTMKVVCINNGKMDGAMETSVMSHVTRHGGSALEYNSYKLKENWNHWVKTGEELETYKGLREQGKW